VRRKVFGGCSSMVEPWIVVPVVAGSIPVIHQAPARFQASRSAPLPAIVSVRNFLLKVWTF
jgi:hypothetical protein